MQHSITAVSYALCAFAYLLVAGLLLVTRAKHSYKALLLAACLVTVAWSAAVTLAEVTSIDPDFATIIVTVLEQVRSAGWMAVMGYILFIAYKKSIAPTVAVIHLTVVSLSVIYLIWQAVAGDINTLGLPSTQASALASILVATGGLVMVENLFRNAGQESRWSLKYLCLALGGVFGYDLVLSGGAALFGRTGTEMLSARGVVDAMMAPFVVLAAARSKSWPIDLHVSRRIVFHSATILIVGIYLVGMSGIGYYLRLLDSPWGVVVRVSFVTAAIVAIVWLVSSSSFHTRIKNFVTRNFFSYRYDYRQEWLNFIAAISGNLGELSIPERLVRALANISDCTAAAAWVHADEDATYRLAATWNISDLPPNVNAHDVLPMALGATQCVIDVKNGTIDGMPAGDSPMPEWAVEHVRVWLIIPLIHSTGLIGFVALGRPRAARDLIWEDYELLKTAGRQGASYIAEDRAAKSLASARRFEDFNRQFAFVVHDIKNLAGQMSLILKNAERHGANPEFQKDVLATVANSSARMQALLSQLKEHRTASAPVTRFDLIADLERLLQGWRMQIPDLRIDLPKRVVDVVADPQRIEAVFNHLIQNAADAAGPKGRVDVRIGLEPPDSDPPGRGLSEGWVTVEIADNGPGMDQKFIDEQLFQPLASTKASGYGLGAYQVRHFVKEIGGQLDVKSIRGQGTCMIVRLPIAGSVMAAQSEAEFRPTAGTTP